MNWSDVLLFGGLTAIAGAGLVVQSACNARLRASLGSPLVAVFVSLVVSMISVLLVFCFNHQGGSPGKIDGGMPWYAWLGGPLGPVYLVISLVVLPRIGAGVLVASIVSGQMLIGLLMDAYGWMGVPVSPVDPGKMLGFLCVLAGVILIQKKSR